MALYFGDQSVSLTSGNNAISPIETVTITLTGPALQGVTVWYIAGNGDLIEETQNSDSVLQVKKNTIMFFAGQQILTSVDGNLTNYFAEYTGDGPQQLILSNWGSWAFSSVKADTNKTITISIIV